MGRIICLLIEVSDDLDQQLLERILRENEFYSVEVSDNFPFLSRVESIGEAVRILEKETEE